MLKNNGQLATSEITRAQSVYLVLREFEEETDTLQKSHYLSTFRTVGEKGLL